MVLQCYCPSRVVLHHPVRAPAAVSARLDWSRVCKARRHARECAMLRVSLVQFYVCCLVKRLCVLPGK